jgi:hypothetical protein
MPHQNFHEQSRQTREKLKQFQEETFLHRHNIAKHESKKTRPARPEPGMDEDGGIFF